ncbi:hypothetical protein MKW92_004907 [Papaver armeniacum]|nr:hypothetical protein MKW92_004907 [Papaver armeniacum]
MEKLNQMKKVKFLEEVGGSLKRERSKFEVQASASAGLIRSLADDQPSKSRKLEEHSVQASTALISSTGVIPKNHIQLVKYSIESRQFMKALKLIKALQSEFPSSALVLALKALVYENYW